MCLEAEQAHAFLTNSGVPEASDDGIKFSLQARIAIFGGMVALSNAHPYMRSTIPGFNDEKIAILNSLVTFAAENVPGGLSEPEQAVARLVGEWALSR